MDIRPSRKGSWTVALVPAALALWCSVDASAQVTPLPARSTIERIDPEERISGNAATGLVLVDEQSTIGRENLWAYLPHEVPSAVQLRISSIDGRYFAQIEYDTRSAKGGWTALELALPEFAFLYNYTESLDEIAALLVDLDSSLSYPVWWGPAHSAADPAKDLPALTDGNRLRVYLNTERATAFVVENNTPSFCRNASAVTGFKFNALCDVSLGAIGQTEDGAPPGNRLDIHRRAGTRSLTPITLNLRIEY